jgi:hypothetical protein
MSTFMLLQNRDSGGEKSRTSHLVEEKVRFKTRKWSWKEEECGHGSR